MKHKHADLIHAWADGAEIQSKFLVAQAGSPAADWYDNRNPDWNDIQIEYRIKPEEKKPVVRWLWCIKPDSIGVVPTAKLYSEEEASKSCLDDYIKLEWSRTEFSE